MELAAAPADRQCLVRRAVTRSKAPDVGVVARPCARVCYSVGALRQRGAARVLEVIDPAPTHVRVSDVPEIDPHVRILVAEQRRELDEALAVVGAPLITAHPRGPGRRIGGVRPWSDGGGG